MNPKEYQQLLFTYHASQRLIERFLTEDDVTAVVEYGEIIEIYETDKPFPSFLFFGFVRGLPIHTVMAYDENNATAYVLTAYIADEQTWQADFKTRRK